MEDRNWKLFKFLREVLSIFRIVLIIFEVLLPMFVFLRNPIPSNITPLMNTVIIFGWAVLFSGYVALCFWVDRRIKRLDYAMEYQQYKDKYPLLLAENYIDEDKHS